MKANLWPAGQKLRVAFRGGSVADRVDLIQAARVWQEVANVRFEFVNRGEAEIRCAFNPGGSWSYVGRDCLSIPPHMPTMNFGWPNDFGRDLHELGHALGLVHEHQWSSIPWNREACYAFYGGPPNGWSRAEVDEQVLDRIPFNALVTTPQWDGKSVMEYPIPPQLVTDPAFSCGWNQVLSPEDMAMIKTLYPGRK